MSIKRISRIAFLSFLFIGCSSTNKSDYNNQTILGVSFNNTGQTQRGFSESPLAKPTYDEYRESIEDKKLNSSTLLP